MICGCVNTRYYRRSRRASITVGVNVGVLTLLLLVDDEEVKMTRLMTMPMMLMRRRRRRRRMMTGRITYSLVNNASRFIRNASNISSLMLLGLSVLRGG